MCSKLVDSLKAELFQYSFCSQLENISLNLFQSESDELPGNKPVDSRVTASNCAEIAFEEAIIDWVESNLSRGRGSQP